MQLCPREADPELRCAASAAAHFGLLRIFLVVGFFVEQLKLFKRERKQPDVRPLLQNLRTFQAEWFLPPACVDRERRERIRDLGHCDALRELDRPEMDGAIAGPDRECRRHSRA